MVFSPDKNVGAALLEKLYDLKGNFLVHSIFFTFQGEMPFAGRPAVFLRLGGCNRGAKDLSCKFCDTSFEIHKSKIMTVEQVFDEIKEKALKGTELIVISGGEPLMQQESIAALYNVVENNWPEEKGYAPRIQIETNGDYNIKEGFQEDFDEMDIICSPKAWDGIDRPFKSLSLTEDFIVAYRFLISATDKEYKTIPKELAKHKLLYLSPMTVYEETSTEQERTLGWKGKAINVEKTLANYSHTIKVAEEHLQLGYRIRLSAQTHLLFSLV